MNRLRKRVLDAYGGKCALCGEDRLEKLTLDHVNDGEENIGKDSVVDADGRKSYVEVEKLVLRIVGPPTGNSRKYNCGTNRV